MSTDFPRLGTHAPGTILGYRKNGQPIYPIAGGAPGDPSVPADTGITVSGYSPARSLPNPGSDHASPVSAIQEPESKLFRVGARSTGGAQAATAAGGVEWAEQQVTTAYDLVLDNAYRDGLIYDMFATKRPTRLTHNGAVVSFNATNDLDDDPTTAELIEDYDVLPSKFKSTHVDIGMKEYGRVVSRTRMTRGVSMMPFDPIAAEKIARNAVGTMDRLAQNAIYAAGGVSFSKTPATFGTAGGVPTAIAPVAGYPTKTLQKIAEQFLTDNVEPFSNGLFAAVITPAEETKLRQESDAGGWRYFQVNQNPSGGTGGIARRQLGVYENFMFFVNNRIVGNKAIFMGADGLAKVYPNVAGFGPAPYTEVAPVIDKLKRFWSYGWGWVGGYGRYKAEAIATSRLDT